MASTMTHRLLLLRHAKSSWDDPSRPDHDRPLSKRGRGAAERIGVHLRELGVRPDLVLCSSSRRTRETLERLALVDADVRLEDGLYAAGDGELLARVREVPDDVASVLLIGHNPGVQDLAIGLAGPDLGDVAARVRQRFPTGGLATFELDGTWRHAAPGRVRLVSFVVPRELG
jgi:phosphohistidine phosphatase